MALIEKGVPVSFVNIYINAYVACAYVACAYVACASHSYFERKQYIFTTGIFAC